MPPCPVGEVGSGQNCTPAPPPAACEVGQNEATCICEPPNTAVNFVCVAPPPSTCIDGQSVTHCICPDGDVTVNLVCYAPCPVNDTGSPPNCLPPPTCPVGQYYGGSLAGCLPIPQCANGAPAPAVGAIANCVCTSPNSVAAGLCVYPTSVTCPAGQYYGGPAVGCLPAPPGMCPSEEIWDNGACATPVLSASLTASPSSVYDDRQSVPDLNCTAPGTCTTLYASATSSIEGDDTYCEDSNNNLLTAPWSAGPFSAEQDGQIIFTVNCHDSAGLTATASATLTISAPPVVPPDLFSCTLSSDGSVTCSWQAQTNSAACYVEVNAQNGGPYGAGVQLSGGGYEGTASTGYLSPSYGPYALTLNCGGSLDANTSGANPITVSP